MTKFNDLPDVLCWFSESCAACFRSEAVVGWAVTVSFENGFPNSLGGGDAQTKVLNDAPAAWLEGSHQVSRFASLSLANYAMAHARGRALNGKSDKARRAPQSIDFNTK